MKEAKSLESRSRISEQGIHRDDVSNGIQCDIMNKEKNTKNTLVTSARTGLTAAHSIKYFAVTMQNSNSGASGVEK